ncbi:MAG: hypothetical protein Q7P63_11560 [Verrucomicrobiota bacterium JB022]|nr:hypothetical protein [Verrucomicrobiota bacterium JB022]
MRPFLSIALITVGCAGAFAVVRTLPVEKCQILHYGDYLNEQGAIEGCGFEEVDFFDLGALRFPLTTSVQPLNELRVDEPAQVRLQLQTVSGKPVSYEDLAISHTKRLHCMVVDQSGRDYQHVHPQGLGAGGEYLLEFQPRLPGTYHVFLDFVMLETGRRILLAEQVEVTGNEHPLAHPAVDLGQSSDHGDYDLRLSANHDGEFRPNETYEFTLQVTPEGDAPLRFQKIMDSFAHVVAFDADKRGFAHLHPVSADLAYVQQDETTEHPDLRFNFRPDRPGNYIVWAQTKLNDQEIYSAYRMTVR